jgi:hypothetical protein
MDRERLLERIYANRFDARESAAKLELWGVLVERFLQRYVRRDGAVLDIGGGRCEFINAVQAREKHLIEIYPAAGKLAAPGVVVHQVDVVSATQGWPLRAHFDHVFVSNFFEHLENRHELFAVLEFCHMALKPGGTLLVIQPNFKYGFREYYDFVDHVLPVTDGSLSEALLALGFQIERMIPRFLPLTTKGRPSSPALLRLYLALPLLWRCFGRQMFVEARRT